MPQLIAAKQTKNRISELSPSRHELGVVSLAALKGIGVGKALKPVTNLIGGIFGNNRKAKRRNRDKLIRALYQAGISRGTFDGVHSDHWKDLQNLAQWIEKTGQPAIQYINETQPDVQGPDWDDKIIARFPQWESRKRALLRKQSTAQVPARQAGFISDPKVKYAALGIGAIGLIAGVAYYTKQNL